MEAHHIRNRTHAFQAIFNLQTERRWCLTGTPVQNSLEDLFTLTEFLRFHPVEDRRNARRWILDPLGTKEAYAIDNLRLLMGTVALRRSKNSEMKRARADLEVAVALTDAEREQYGSIRAKAQKMVASADKASPAHNLLSYILQMRQVCSHGLHDRFSGSGYAAVRRPLPSNSVCNKCLEALPQSLVSRLSSVNGDESTYCRECAAEEHSTPDLIIESLSARNGLQDRRKPPSQTDFGVPEVLEDGDVAMDLDYTISTEPRLSSKVHAVIDNLVQLGTLRHADSTPIKR